MWAFVVMLVIGVGGILSSFFSQGLSALTFYGILLLGVPISLVAIVLFFLKVFEKKNWIWYFVSVIIYILYVIYLPNIYHFTRGYYLVNNHLKEYKDSGKVIGVDKKNYRFGGNDSCSYTFNVKLNDSSNIVFQAGYCEIGSMWTDYGTVDNYDHYYLPYYYDMYKKNNKASFRLVVNNDEFLTIPCEIHYTNDQIAEVCNFLKYLDEKNNGEDYQIEMYNDEENDYYIANSWNHFEIDHRCMLGVDY